MQLTKSPDSDMLRGDCDSCSAPLSIHRRSGADITCRCGAAYNAFGQRLAPRHFWDEG